MAVTIVDFLQANAFSGGHDSLRFIISRANSSNAHSKLVRAGFLRQAHSGIFHMLPLGQRVQSKLELLIDKHMAKLNASKLALSSISSEELWRKSGRLNSSASELFHLLDRKEVAYLLSPTHEEEITSLVASTVRSYKELPIRLYQISRKYRDELRPRHGVLRSREFLMKDLYTFDYSEEQALATYHEVRQVYARLFDELKIPYLIAEADSGDMGGSLSHEFHFPTSVGEDHIISCMSCNYIANEEMAESLGCKDILPTDSDPGYGQVKVWRGISQDRNTLINAWYPSTPIEDKMISLEPEINIHAIKTLVPDLDTTLDNPVSIWVEAAAQRSKETQLINLVDSRLPKSFARQLLAHDTVLPVWPAAVAASDQDHLVSVLSVDSTNQSLNLLRIRDGDSCSHCVDGRLKVQRAIELGHTFHLGTRYSAPLKAVVSVPIKHLQHNSALSTGELRNPESTHSCTVPMQMGCHGIGVSRMIGAVADTLADEKGLNWPRVMAPYEVVVVPGHGLAAESLEVYDTLADRSLLLNVAGSPNIDVVLDDRGLSFVWKLQDADLVGYPVVVIVGKSWKVARMCEVQCRRLKIREDVPLDGVLEFVRSLLVQL
ncbi:hypothetical protein BP5796_07984 [Coleophoma crateriformis]|uniref:proline--tRNA ligase n=1 Tax=Coleophoma crateriformis TaxID=565419 RepID=A0A3D8RDA3_9HELO|nr:hypothetical protein BP5796_07984 [Coleophoma crateriformis]